MLGFADYPLIDEALFQPWSERCVSAIIATYNRAPCSPQGPQADDNPLDFCLRALGEQRHAPLLEVVVVDDCSTDYTADVVERWRPRFAQVGVQIVLLRTKQRLDAHGARNLGALHARGRLLYVLDDDSVVPPHALAGAYETYVRAKAKFPTLCALALPVYQRATVPLGQADRALIATLDRQHGEARGGFDCFPSEYARGEVEYLDEQGHWLLPIAVDNLCGAHALLDREAMLEVGGFPVLPTRGYGGETGLALALRRHGYDVRLAVDPRLHAVHLRYGNPRAATLHGDDWRSYLGLSGPSLVRMVELAAVAKEDTGCRVAAAVWYYARLRNTLWLMRKHEPVLAERFVAYAQRAFVERNQLGDVVGSSAHRNERARILRVAHADADRMPEQTLAELEARLTPPPLSAVLLNYKRPDNVRTIVARLKTSALVDDITVWNNCSELPLRADAELACVNVVNASNNSLLARCAAALLGEHEHVLLQDDDLCVPEQTLAQLYARFCEQPDLIHGIFGRDPKPDGSYARESNQVDAEVDVVLTRCLLVHRTLLAGFFAHAARFGLQDADPPGNGEDIVLSYVARKRSGRKNRVYALPVEELPAPHAVHRLAGHRTHRTSLMKRCLAWLSEEDGPSDK